MNNYWLSVAKIYEYLGIKRDTVYKWISEKKLPAHRVGKLWKFKISEVERVTGIDFFPERPDKIEERLENNINVTDWSWGKSKSYTTNK